MPVNLVVVNGRPEGMEIPVPTSSFLIGRDPGCNLRPSSEVASRRHCEIRRRESRVFVSDLDSTNGTFINDVRIEGEVEVFDGDQLRIGPLVFGLKIRQSSVLPVRVAADTDKDSSPSPPDPVSTSDTELLDSLEHAQDGENAESTVDLRHPDSEPPTPSPEDPDA